MEHIYATRPRERLPAAFAICVGMWSLSSTLFVISLALPALMGGPAFNADGVQIDPIPPWSGWGALLLLSGTYTFYFLSQLGVHSAVLAGLASTYLAVLGVAAYRYLRAPPAPPTTAGP